MERRGVEIKVGLFVLVAIVVAAFLILRFGKGNRFANDAYLVTVRFTEVGGIIRGAKVYYLGVDAGRVVDINLDTQSNRVKVILAISKGTPIPSDARFEIRQVGLLGDKVISISPTLQSAKVKPLASGAEVEGLVPLDLTSLAEQANLVARKVSGFLDDLDAVAKRLNTELLDPQTLANARATLANTATATRESAETIHELKALLKTNRAAVDSAIANFATLTANLDRTARKVDSLVTENSSEVSASVDNIRKTIERLRSSAERIDTLLAKIENGEGLLGLMLSDTETKEHLQKTLTDLAAFSASVRKRGILWYKDISEPKPRPQEEEKKAEAPASGKGGVIYQKPESPKPTQP
jgi:phospholipid/cholesterol/gamma-HCH transport system substrate-binding protein